MSEKIKVYTIKLNGETGWTTENPEDFREELQMFKDEENMELDIDGAIRWVKELEIGEGYSAEPIVIECSEMDEEKYRNLPEFSGW